MLATIGELTKGKALITIAHRLSNVRTAVRIVVIDKGRIIQKGTHKELARRDEIYRRISKTAIRIHRLATVKTQEFTVTQLEMDSLLRPCHLLLFKLIKFNDYLGLLCYKGC